VRTCGGAQNAAKCREMPRNQADQRLQRALFRRYYYQKLSGAATDHPAQDGMARRRRVLSVTGVSMELLFPEHGFRNRTSHP
jgi:hypothetical protein